MSFPSQQYIPDDQDEYYLRNSQFDYDLQGFRKTTNSERELLLKANNVVEDWDRFFVVDPFLPERIHSSRFYGLNRIGRMDKPFLNYHELVLPQGIYNSMIISCDFGDNVAVSDVGYMAHYIIGSEVIILCCNEIHVTEHAKYGNGILKEGEDSHLRVQIEVINENKQRGILPFEGINTTDAFIWSKNRGNKILQEKLIQITDNMFDKRRGYYGVIGAGAVIKHCKVIKDVKIGPDAYIKGANKLKNLTVLSDVESPSQIGEGVEMVNGIMGYGSRSFYGVKAVRFVMGENTTLKYGARLINSVLGDNSTISCCEVLNSLIFPGHEQHHNNSFLCASLIGGQSNIASGATIGSNHNSRRADGELYAGRGFWPGLCVSLKHNSRFASFTILAKGHYPAEIDSPFPFALLNNDVASDELQIMPAYWWMYNLYSLFRNDQKYKVRDLRKRKSQIIHTGFLAPDTVSEMLHAMAILENVQPDISGNDTGILTDYRVENSKRPVRILKLSKSLAAYRDMILYFTMENILHLLVEPTALPLDSMTGFKVDTWINAGGQLMPKMQLDLLLTDIVNGTLQTWQQIHQRYEEIDAGYKIDAMHFALACLLRLQPVKSVSDLDWATILEEYERILEYLSDGLKHSRAKDFENPFRKMVYDSDEEMEAVLGDPLEDDIIVQTLERLQARRTTIERIRSKQLSALFAKG